MKKALLIVNPKAGVKKHKAQIAESVRAALEGDGIELTIISSHVPGDIGGMISDYVSSGCGMVIVAGGDGTVNEAASALWNSGVALGIIPIGSGNGLARSLDIPQSPAEAIATIGAGRKVCIDRGVANGKPFYCTLGMGLDALVSQRFSQEKRRGRTTYIKDTLLEYLTFIPEKYELLFGGKRVVSEATVLAVCNSPQYGNNAYIAPRADMTDGLLDVTIVRPGNIFTDTLAGIELFTRRLDNNILVESFRVGELTIKRTAPEVAQIDGEVVTLPAEIEVRCEKGGLEVFVPEGYGARETEG